MFSKFRRIGSRKVSVKTAVLVIALMLFAVTAIAARYESLTVGDLYVDDIAALSENYTLDITSPNFKGTLSDQSQPTIVDLGGTSVYTLTGPGIYWIDDYLSTDGSRGSGSGVSILFPNDITDAYEGYYRIQKMTSISGIDSTAGVTAFSGTTDIVVSAAAWSSGVTVQFWNVTTGVTHESSGKLPCEIDEIDAVGDYLEFFAKNGDGGSGDSVYQTGRYIQ